MTTSDLECKNIKSMHFSPNLITFFLEISLCSVQYDFPKVFGFAELNEGIPLEVQGWKEVASTCWNPQHLKVEIWHNLMSERPLGGQTISVTWNANSSLQYLFIKVPTTAPPAKKLIESWQNAIAEIRFYTAMPLLSTYSRLYLFHIFYLGSFGLLLILDNAYSRREPDPWSLLLRSALPPRPSPSQLSTCHGNPATLGQGSLPVMDTQLP